MLSYEHSLFNWQNAQRFQDCNGDVARLYAAGILFRFNIDGEKVATAVFFHSADKPTGSKLSVHECGPRFTGKYYAVLFRLDDDPADNRHVPGQKRQIILIKTPQQFDLFFGAYFQRSVKPELGNPARNIPVSVRDGVQIVLHLFCADAGGQFLIIPHD